MFLPQVFVLFSRTQGLSVLSIVSFKSKHQRASPSSHIHQIVFRGSIRNVTKIASITCIFRTHEPPETRNVHGLVCGFTVVGGAFMDLRGGIYGFQGWAFLFFFGGGVFMVWREDVHGFGVAFNLWGRCFDFGGEAFSVSVGRLWFFGRDVCGFGRGVCGFGRGISGFGGKRLWFLWGGGFVVLFLGRGGLWFCFGGGVVVFWAGGREGVLVLVCWREVVLSSLPLGGVVGVWAGQG